jgi:endonuclease/exonuclease/phosphatase family metal-dependent hydrolase
MRPKQSLLGRSLSLAPRQTAPLRARSHAPFLLVLALACTHATRAIREARPNEPRLRVLTYNLNYGIAGDPETIEAIAARDADLIFLQETNAAWRAALEPQLKGRYPGRVWLDGAAAEGMAVLSKRPLRYEKLPSPDRWFPALRVVTETPLGKVQALCVHLHPPVTDDGSWVRGYFSTGTTRRYELDTWLDALEPGVPALVAGDFNEGTSGDAVTWLEAHGLRTALPEFQPRAVTWHWPVSSSLEARAQLDHVAYDAHFEPIDAHVEAVGNSDHYPVTVDLVRADRTVRRPEAPSGRSLTLSIGSSP